MREQNRNGERRSGLKTCMGELHSLTLRVGDPTLIPPRLQGGTGAGVESTTNGGVNPSRSKESRARWTPPILVCGVYEPWQRNSAETDNGGFQTMQNHVIRCRLNCRNSPRASAVSLTFVFVRLSSAQLGGLEGSSFKLQDARVGDEQARIHPTFSSSSGFHGHQSLAAHYDSQHASGAQASRLLASSS